jgi:NADH-quinone oxidoreductase subunit M
MDFPILSILIFLPLVGALFLIPLNGENKARIRWAALWISIVEFAISVPLFFCFNSTTAEMQFVEKQGWLWGFGQAEPIVHYSLGLDGLSLLLVLLTTFLTPIVLLSTWSAVDKRVKEFMFALLALETAMLGTLLALDLFLFYVFWEVMLVPMFLIIGVWGGERRIYATIKFFLYTMVGSVLMLAAILYLVWFQYGASNGTQLTFDLMVLNQTAPTLTRSVQLWLFAAFAFSFAIKVPMFPLHTWLPDAHVEAPTAGSVILAGVLLKMGTYGFVRFAMPLFPEATVAAVPFMSVLSIIGIIYGALVAMVQPDLKKLVAYSSVSHLGYVMLGLFSLTAQGVSGGIYQMLNHGLSTGALFLLVGVIYERRHTRLISEFGGLTKVMPVYAVVFMIVTLSSVGLPLTNGFVGEFLILVGTFLGAHPLAKVFAFFAATGVILGAVYMLWMFQRVMFGPVTNEKNLELADLNGRELTYLMPLLVFIMLMGIYPKPFLSRMEPSVQHFIHRFEVVQMAEAAERQLPVEIVISAVGEERK